MISYTSAKELYIEKRGHGGLSVSDNMKASTLSGALVVILTNPIWTVKTRMITQNTSAKDAYRGVTRM